MWIAIKYMASSRMSTIAFFLPALHRSLTVTPYCSATILMMSRPESGGESLRSMGAASFAAHHFARRCLRFFSRNSEETRSRALRSASAASLCFVSIRRILESLCCSLLRSFNANGPEGDGTTPNWVCIYAALAATGAGPFKASQSQSTRSASSTDVTTACGMPC